MMKKITSFICIVLILASVVVMSTSCNKQLFDTSYNFNYAYVSWPDGTNEKIAIKSWNDYDGEQLQIKTSSGKIYVFHSSNCVLACE